MFIGAKYFWNLIRAKLALLALFLTDDFWTLRTDETNRYEPVLGHANTEESGSD